ncbi:hypothetical protein U1701_17630 [Sphingomonas sp. PB2P19]|uniref:hypothetical protein n=1 Tax=Sphingomonas rhamnosi TaxID=3096156 RepID=UPI002FCA4200
MSRHLTDTSAAAYAGIADMASHLRAIVHRTLYDHPAGLTVDEVCSLAGYPRYSLQPRFTELRHKEMIRDTGLRRRNVSGAKAIVWRATVIDQQGSAA